MYSSIFPETERQIHLMKTKADLLKSVLQRKMEKRGNGEIGITDTTYMSSLGYSVLFTRVDRLGSSFTHDFYWDDVDNVFTLRDAVIAAKPIINVFLGESNENC